MVRVAGPWQVAFDPKWGGPESATFDELTDWTERPEGRRQALLGAAVYRTTFDLPEGLASGYAGGDFIDLGSVKNIAAVSVNDKRLAWRGRRRFAWTRRRPSAPGGTR